MRLCAVLLLAALLLPLSPQPAAAATPTPPDGPLPLSAYPRPEGDNGLGIHWGTRRYGQSDAVVDYFVDEMSAMGIHWLKFLNDGTEGRHNEYLIQQAVKHDIMPVMRVYERCNKAFDLGSLRRLVEHYRPMGVYYYELFNEPELPGVDGGWCDGEEPDPERLLNVWLPAAKVIVEAGGYPGLPSIFPPSTKDPEWRDSFFMRFLRGVKERGDTAVLYRSWASVHNYFLNHPIDYPYDAVNLRSVPLTAAETATYGLSSGQVAAINQARKDSRKPRGQGGYFVGDTINEDSSCFLMFQAYRNRFYELYGFEIPLISTEGGATVGSSEDPRYPPLTAELMADRTVEAYEYMLSQAPAYYFAFTTWLLADGAIGNFGSAWESWTWYRNTTGDHLPVVERLKNHPQNGASRLGGAQGTSGTVVHPGQRATPAPSRRAGSPPPAAVAAVATATPTTPAPAAARPPASGDLSRFPRPPADNGRGIHWVPTLFGQSTDVVDRFVGEMAGLGIKWVKIMQPDQEKVEHEYLLQALAQRGMMPVLRIHRPDNAPYEHLEALVKAARPMGVYYFELYNEPNIEGEAGAWRAGQPISVETIAANWLAGARQVVAAGGFPSLPAPSPGGNYEDGAFLRAFLRQVKSLGGGDVLAQSWVALHNYFLNHPLDYPEDPVNLRSVPLSAEEIASRRLSDSDVQSINNARAISRLPRSQGGFHVGDTIYEDSNAFRKFEAYERIVREETGLVMPIITTEGGAVAGTQEDPRYPRMTEQDVADETAAAFEYMTEQAPDYYFAFMPWIIANLAAGNGDSQWEGASWFRGGAGQPMPVVEAIRQLAARGGQRRANTPALPAESSPAPAASTAPGSSASPSGTPSAAGRGWAIFWRDGKVFNCTPIELSVARPPIQAWQPPIDGHTWAMEIRDAEGRQLATQGPASSANAGLPAGCGFWAPPAAPAATPTPASRSRSNTAARDWDARLDQLDVKVHDAPAVFGLQGWGLVSARYEDAAEAGGRHHIYVRLLDENGQDIGGTATVTVSWTDGQQAVPYQRKGGDDPYSQYGANFPMFGPLGSYSVSVAGMSDTVTGMGMPGKQHVNFVLVFQRGA